MMEKTELMEEYEARTGLKSTRVVGDHWCNEEAHTESYVDDLEERILKAQEHLDNLEFLIKQKNGEILQLQTKAESYDRLSVWHDDLPKNDGRYICAIGNGGYPVICAKRFENGRWLLGEREKIKWAYLPDGWEEK